MKIDRFRKKYIPEAAALFVQGFQGQRRAAPCLPALMEDARHVQKMLDECFEYSSGVVALERGRLAGYLAWFTVDHFRESDRRGAYVPEWGHACPGPGAERTYQALYRAAGEDWFNAGCQVHAITVLAADAPAEQAWYWNGFGLAVVDAIRPMHLLGLPQPAGLRVRRAALQDVELLSDLDAEHWEHYARSPMFMAPRPGRDIAAQIELLSRSRNSTWLALDGDVPAGFMRFEGYDFDSAAVLESEEGIMITGAYVRPDYRGRKAAAAMLDAALGDYEARGLRYCAVNYESFNPEAATFWRKYFQPVCYSLMRVPEAGPRVDNGRHPQV